MSGNPEITRKWVLSGLPTIHSSGLQQISASNGIPWGGLRDRLRQDTVRHAFPLVIACGKLVAPCTLGPEFSLSPLSLVVSALQVLDLGTHYFRSPFAVKFVCQMQHQDVGGELGATPNYRERLMHYW
jgi:hypothetical protein